MREVIERLGCMPIEVETLDNGKYVVRIAIAGETDYLTLEELHKLFRALFLALGVVDKKIDRKESKGA